MALIRPKVLVRFGRQNEPVRVPFYDLTVDTLQTFLTADNASATGTLTVKSIANFTTNQVLMIGEYGNQGSEIIKTHASSSPSGSTITLASNTLYPHSAGTKVYLINFDKVEISSAATSSGSKTVLVTTNILPGLLETVYNDTTSTVGFYFARFKNSITSGFSSYSDAVPVGGYGITSARSIIDNALSEINRKTTDVLNDEYAFTQINNCQMETLRELKRWSFMQSFDAITTQLVTGAWKVPLPADCDDQNTNKSIYRLRIGREDELTWIDKEQFNDIIEGTAYTTLSANLTAGATSATLTNSNDFDASGTINVRSTSLAYTANNKVTGVLTLSAAVVTPYNAGVEVFLFSTLGRPQYWTTFGGNIYVLPITSSSYNGRNVYIDYYKSLTAVTTDSDVIVLPDPTLVQYYLQWKFLKRINNGDETEGSLEAKKNYEIRRDKMKNKEVMNRNFVIRPRFQNFQTASEFDNTDSEKQRTGNFPNT